MPCGLNPLHAILALPRPPMRGLAAIVQIATLSVLYPGQELALGRAVALELIGNDDAGHVSQPLEQFAKKLLGRFLVSAALYQNVEHVVVLVDSAP
jgi:hypothetical protein